MRRSFFISFLITAILSLRRVIWEDKVLGHNWDWVFPATDFLFQNLNLPTKYTWWEMNLGTVSDLNLSHLVPDTILVLLAHVFEPKWVILIFLFSILTFSFLFFKKLLDITVKESDLNYLPSFLYAFSPFLFNDIIGGSWYMWLSYAFAPIFFVELLAFVKTFKVKNLLFFLLSGIAVISSLQDFVLMESIFLFYLIYLVSLEKFSLRRAVIGYVSSHLILLLFNLYWVAPFLANFQNFKASPALAGDLLAVRANSQNLVNIFSLIGYLDRNMYYHALSQFLIPLFIFSVILIWLAIGSLFLKKPSKKFLFWFLTLIIAIFFIKGGNSPLGDLTIWFFEKIPFLRLYRSPQHLVFAAAFIIPILVCFALNHYYSSLKHKKKVLGFFFIFIFLWISGWWFSGDLGHQILMDKKKDHLDFYSLSPGMEDVYQRNEQVKTDQRILFLPSAWSVKYLPTEYQNQAEGGQAEYMYLKNPTFTGGFNPAAETVEFSFCQPKTNDLDLINFLALFSVKNIVLREDVHPSFTTAKNCWFAETAKTRLDANPYLDKFLEKKYAVGYQIKDDYFLPRFYVPQNIIYSNQNTSLLTDFNIFSKLQLKSAIFLDNSQVSGNLAELEGIVDEDARDYLIQPQLIPAFGEEIISGRDVDVEYQTVVHDPKSLFWKLALLKENFFEWEAGKDKEKLLKLELRYANKRVVELGKFEILDSSPLLKIYQGKIEKSFELLNQIEDKEKKALYQEKIRDNLLYNLQGVKEMSWRNEILSWLKKIEEPDSQANPLTIEYQFTVPTDGEYLIFFEDNTGLLRQADTNLKKWKIKIDGKQIEEDLKFEKDRNVIEIGKVYLKANKNKSSLMIDYSDFPASQLEGENPFLQQIKNWPPDTRFYVSGSAQFAEEGIRLAIDETILDARGETPTNLARELTIFLKGSQFNFYTKSSRDVQNARIYFAPKENKEKFYQESKIKDLKIYPLYTPKIFFKLNKEATTQHNEKKDIPKITFTKINPVKYRINIEEARNSYILAFNENFNKNWELYLSDKRLTASGQTSEIFLEPATFETWGKRPIAQDRHFQVNGYANSWLIKPEDTNFQENYELIVEFWPQRLFYLGLLLSSVILIMSCFSYLLFNLNEKKKVVRNS